MPRCRTIPIPSTSVFWKQRRLGSLQEQEIESALNQTKALSASLLADKDNHALKDNILAAVGVSNKPKGLLKQEEFFFFARISLFSFKKI